MDQQQKTSYRVQGKSLFGKIKELIREGNVRRIIIKNEAGDVYLRIPVTAGVIGALIIPPLAVVGALAAMTGIFIVEIQQGADQKAVKKTSRKK